MYTRKRGSRKFEIRRKTTKKCQNHGGKIIVDATNHRYFIWNDWPLSEIRELGGIGDVLGQGSWGKIVVSDDTTVSKIPMMQTNQSICNEFHKEYTILSELYQKRYRKNSNYCNVQTLHSDLMIIQYTAKGSRVRGDVAVIKKKYDKHTQLSADEGCLFFMERLYKPKLETLLRIVSPEFHNEYIVRYDDIYKPYYLFLGRISRQSIYGGKITVTDVDSLPLSKLDGVTIMKVDGAITFERLFDSIQHYYPGTQIVVSNYLISDNSPAMYYGVGICKYIWRTFLHHCKSVNQHIYLFDTEFVLGNRFAELDKKTSRPNCYIIDCNRCEMLASMDMDAFVNSVAEGMELCVDGVNPEHWGGFLPNPLISPAFAFRCWNSVFEDEETLVYMEFMIVFLRKLNHLLASYGQKKMVVDKTMMNTMAYYVDSICVNDTFRHDSYEIVPLVYFDLSKHKNTMDVHDSDTDEFLQKMLFAKSKTLYKYGLEFCCLWKRAFLLEAIFSFMRVYVETHAGLMEKRILLEIAKHKLLGILPDANLGFLESLLRISAFSIHKNPPSKDDMENIVSNYSMEIEEDVDLQLGCDVSLFGKIDDNDY